MEIYSGGVAEFRRIRRDPAAPPGCLRLNSGFIPRFCHLAKFTYLCSEDAGKRPDSCPQKTFLVESPGNCITKIPITMAKGNMLLGFARGKVGSLVFKRQNGEQVTTPRVKPSNPQTHAQMKRRVAFAAAAKTAKALRMIVDHSFQGVPYGEKSMQHFVKLAAKKAFVGVEAAENSTLSAAPFQLAPIVPPSAYNVAAGGEFVISQGDLASVQGITKSGDAYSIHGLTTTTTLAQFCEKLGITIDSQLTFVAGKYEELDTESEYVMAGVKYEIVRINFKQDAANTPIYLAGELNPAIVDAERSSSMDAIQNAISFEEPEPGETAISAQVFVLDWSSSLYTAIIVSKYENGGWRRSNETLTSRFGYEHASQPDFQENTAYNDLEETISLYLAAGSISREEYLNQESNPT